MQAMDQIEHHACDIEALERVYALLESPSVVTELTHLVGKLLKSALRRGFDGPCSLATGSGTGVVISSKGQT